MDFPLRIANIPKELTLSSEHPASARVSVTATGKSILTLHFMDKVVFADLSRAKWGPQEITLSENDIRFGGETDISSKKIIYPATLDITLNTLVSKQVDIVPDIEADPAPGFLISGIVPASSWTAEISGARPDIAGIENIKTVRTELKDIKSDTVLFIPVIAPGSFSLSIKPDSVRVAVKVDKKVRKTIKGIPIRLINKPSGTKTELSSETIGLIAVGPEKTLKKIGPRHFSAVIDFSRIELENKTSLSPEINSFIDGIEWYNINPEEITVRSSRK